MGDNTKIEWADHTFNPWIGCTKVSDGCKFCYAENMMDHRLGRVDWGPKGTRMKTSSANWRKPFAWDNAAKALGERHRVFCSSLADVFEDWKGMIVNNNGDEVRYLGDGCVGGCNDFACLNEAKKTLSDHRRANLDHLRLSLFDTIDKTTSIDWLLLTKRPENIHRMWCGVCGSGDFSHNDDCVTMTLLRNNVWLLTSVENQEQADKRIPELIKCRDLAPVLGLSVEPMLGQIDITEYLPHLDWVICGGESGHNARPMNPIWATQLRDQCSEFGVPFFFKQWGEWVEWDFDAWDNTKYKTHQFSDIANAHGDFPVVHRVGKKMAGRKIYYHEWNQLPLGAEEPF